MKTPAAAARAADKTTRPEFGFLDWHRWQWWVGCVVGSFGGGVLLTLLRIKGDATPAALLTGGLIVGGAQVMCLLVAHAAWRACAPSSRSAPAL